MVFTRTEALDDLRGRLDRAQTLVEDGFHRQLNVSEQAIWSNVVSVVTSAHDAIEEAFKVAERANEREWAEAACSAVVAGGRC